MYEALANVTSQMFGDGKSTSSDSPSSASTEKVAKTSHEAINMFRSVFGR